MATWSMMNLQDGCTPVSEFMISFHDSVMMVILMIMSLIIYMFYSILNNSFVNRYLLQGHTIEVIWTLIPVFILIYLIIPSLNILYLTEEAEGFHFTVKVVGHQWYWSYEYMDLLTLEFDSYMLKEGKLSMFRLLDVDNRMVVPRECFLRVLITSADVIHSWAVPSLGVKVDAVPGRLNQIMLMTIRPGLYFGQCSEICGANHSFMPIVVESTNLDLYLFWV
uniref:Cytochrome c oxidase subunit 2 n=1 Tax=Mellinus arvensis TaxID=1507147 RepID=A0A7L7S3B4_9HYME|nr:cytochrome c oxidase subunit II [Mellinus arvensis]